MTVVADQSRHTGEAGRVKSPCSSLSDPVCVVPAQAGTQGFQALAPCSSPGQALGPRLRGDDDLGRRQGFLYSLEGRCPVRRWVPAFAGMTKSIDPVRRRLAGRFSITEG